MDRLFLGNDHIKAWVIPELGALVGGLSIEGCEILYIEEDKLSRERLAGGIPVLFPFVSKTIGDCAQFNGKPYPMPMHGFAKSMPFIPVSQTTSRLTLRLDSNDETRHYYPFDFRFELEYALDGAALWTTASVTNRSSSPMPLALGFHHYFRVQDRERAELRFNLIEFDDYLHAVDGQPVAGRRNHPLDLRQPLDHVFRGDNASFLITSLTDGYEADVSVDDSFTVLTVYTGQQGAVCAEPWQGRPNAVNDPGGSLILKPGQTSVYSTSLRVRRL